MSTLRFASGGVYKRAKVETDWPEPTPKALKWTDLTRRSKRSDGAQVTRYGPQSWGARDKNRHAVENQEVHPTVWGKRHFPSRKAAKAALDGKAYRTWA